jgi:ABC-2 type transport system permease protein
MSAIAQHLKVGIRLHFRNKMALIYGYLFPLVFLLSFWVLYRHEKAPLSRHLGELLTVSVLGGACFGLPTTLVSERERGVWRRFRLAPISIWTLLSSTIVTRALIVLSAGLLQLALGFALGLAMPAHPWGLWAAFTVVSFSFIGLGLVIAMLADNVPAVQALGQCIFLPMLIIGGVAVPLSSLPSWAQHVSAFFPGRYAVEAMQDCVTGAGLGSARFSLVSLGLIGFAGCLAGARLFRWDNQQRFALSLRTGGLFFALAAWLAVGLMAEHRGHIAVVPHTSGVAATPELPSSPPPAPAPVLPSWRTLTPKDIDQLDYSVPADEGVVAPIASLDERPDDDAADAVDAIKRNLSDWEPGKAKDPVQRARNLLCVPAVLDVAQHPVEKFVPRVIFDQLQRNFPKDDLVKILAWIVMHPEDGSLVESTTTLGVDVTIEDADQIRERTVFYAIKLIARLTNRKLVPGRPG